MTIHSSLKTKSGALSQHRNVLKRSERIAKLSSQEKFLKEKSSPLGLVKVGNIMVHAGKKPAKKVEGEAGAVAGAPGAAGTAAAAPGAKGAAPAGGAKAAAGAKPAAGAAAAKPAAGAKGDKKK